MTKGKVSRFGFRIARLDEEPPQPAPPEPEEPEPAPPVEPEPVESQPAASTPDPVGGRFHSASCLLSFLSAVAGVRLSSRATCRRNDQGAWWAELYAPRAAAANLIWTGGGLPYLRQNDTWRALPGSGDLPGADAETLDADKWPRVALNDLMDRVGLRAGRNRTSGRVFVVTNGLLARWIVRRAYALNTRVTLQQAQRLPMTGDDPGNPVLFLTLTRRGASVPAALVQAVSALPYTTAALQAGPGGDNLLLDVGYRLPLTTAMIGELIPPDETWVLGAPEEGRFRLSRHGEVLDGAGFLQAPATPVAQTPAGQAPVLPQPIPVRLVPKGRVSGHIDAVLLDDTELDWLRTWLAGRPAGETCFFLPGAGAHLLTAPGGLPAAVPFGTPLQRIGPGALFLEMGLGFYPRLPEHARAQTFAVDDETAVAVTDTGAWRFQREHMTPAWTLWAGEAPVPAEGLSARGRAALQVLDQALRQQQKQGPVKKLLGMLKPAPKSDLLNRAQRAELRGDLVQAAELLESAGELDSAARLYERAARRQ